MSKRLTQEGKPGEEERVVAKSKPMWNEVLKTVDRSPQHWVRVHLKAWGHSKHKVRIWIWHSDVNTNTSTGRFVAERTRKIIEDIREQCWSS